MFVIKSTVFIAMGMDDYFDGYALNMVPNEPSPIFLSIK